MHPSVEATLCDFVPTLRKNYEGRLWSDIIKFGYQDFLNTYRVEDWGITQEVFSDFVHELMQNKRCNGCGEKSFPYYLDGDKECIRCAVH